MATTNLVPLANYPTGIRTFGPIATPNGLSGMMASVQRCTSITPTIWPNVTTRVKLSLDCSYDGGNTWQEGQFAWEQGGGILIARGGAEIPFSNVSFDSTPEPTHIKGSVEVINGPCRTKVDLTLS